MSRLKWDQVGERLYETGVKEMALYLADDEGNYTDGVAWNGISSVEETPSGAEPTDIFADDIKYVTLMSNETYGSTITAYSSPEEFDEADGTKELAPGITIGQQNRRMFGFAYKSTIGNDVKGNDFGYTLTLVYGAKASPSSKTHSTINDSPEAAELSWEVNTTPVPVTGFAPTSVMRIKSYRTDPALLKELEDILYGTEDTEPRLPLPDEVVEIIKKYPTDGGDTGSSEPDEGEEP